MTAISAAAFRKEAVGQFEIGYVSSWPDAASADADLMTLWDQAVDSNAMVQSGKIRK